MIRPKIFAIQRELIIAAEAPDWDARCRNIRDWWDKYVINLSYTHSISREYLERNNGAGLAKHIQKKMHYQLAEEIQNKNLSACETDVNREDLDPYATRTDQISIWLIGASDAHD